MSESKIENVVIIGSGAAGLTAAIYNARAELNPLVIEGEQAGGQLTITSDVENYPGFVDPVVGPELMSTMKAQAEKFGARCIAASVKAVDFQSRPFTLTLSDDTVLKAKTVIIATGAVAKWLNVPGEEALKGKGVSACATCDGYFFRNLDIAVVGGGDTALEEATFLTRYAKSVTLIHRRSELRGSAAMVKKAQANPKITFIWDSIVKSCHGTLDNGSLNNGSLNYDSLEYLILENVKTEIQRQLKVQGLFVAIGHTPNSLVFANEGLKFDETGYILRKGENTATDNTATDIPGVFVAGDICDPVYRQAITAAGMGCQAAIDAQHFLESSD